MSLQVWLPLNGNLNNYGVSAVSVSGTNTYGNGGKLGGKYLNSNASIPISVPAIKGTKVCSFAFWAYVVSASITTNWTLVARMDDQGTNSGSHMRFEVCPSSYSNGTYCFSNHNNTNYGLTSGVIISPSGGYYDKWVHFCFTSDGTTFTRYMNGVKVGTCAYSGAATLSGGFLLANNDKCYKQDVRIYDHCLSQKEVQELAKGLVLHYRLAGPGQENIIEHSHNGSGWSIGSGWTAFTDGDGTKGYRFTRTGATANNWVRVIPPTKINPNDYPEGITVSIDIKTPDISAVNHTCVGALQIYDSTGTRSGWCEPHWDLSKVKNNVWTRVSYFFTQAQLKTISQSGMTYSYTMFSFQLVQNGDISIKNFKAERGNVQTPWTPNKADAAWTTMGYSNNIEYDCSGYGNNGTIKYPPTWDVNSPRYTTSYKFDGTAYLTIPNPFPVGTVVREFSHTAWIKWDSACNTNNGIHSISYSNSFFRFALGKGSQIWTYGVRCNADGSGESQTSILTHGALSSLVHNKWYFIAITFKDGVCKAYLDGEQVASTTSTLVGLKSNTSEGAIGAYMSNGAERAIGNISDSRFYVTELSEEAIQELYHSAVIIDNTGKTYAYEYFEAT